MKNLYLTIAFMMALLVMSCGKTKKEEQVSTPVEETISDKLSSALTLYASFDNGIDADRAKGDPKLYTIMNRRQPDSSMIGLHKDSVSYSGDLGKNGGALLFSGKTRGSIFYKGEQNIAYDTTNWNGAISFWLKLNPDKDLRPGFCDPIQITDVSYNDAAIWVDFTKTLPRSFRLGVIEDRVAWNPNPEGPDNENPLFMELLIGLENPPFNNNRWTHVLVNFSGLNSNDGSASLYVDGKPVGTRAPISNPFTWELQKSNIYLGLSYIGLFDELSIFNRALSDKEIQALYKEEVTLAK